MIVLPYEFLKTRFSLSISGRNLSCCERLNGRAHNGRSFKTVLYLRSFNYDKVSSLNLLRGQDTPEEGQGDDDGDAMWLVGLILKMNGVAHGIWKRSTSDSGTSGWRLRGLWRSVGPVCLAVKLCRSRLSCWPRLLTWAWSLGRNCLTLFIPDSMVDRASARLRDSLIVKFYGTKPNVDAFSWTVLVSRKC
ncbi:hypothetical protein SUGI_0454310 [Cryptomeria japonica]|nr:hypothetical protein SUGI_0454310 [Cryptomeria japonica]